MRKTITALLLAIVAWAAVPAIAAEGEGPDLDAIRTQQQELRSLAVAGSGPFDGVSQVRRNEIVARQDRLLALLEGRDDFDELSWAHKLEAFNTLEWIKTALNDNEGDQLVCEYRSNTGSHRRTRVCESIEERRKAREESKLYWETHFRRAFCSNALPCNTGG